MITTLPKKNFKGYTAILASPSVGNVSQLCLDLVISTLKCTHLGMIWHEGLLPFVGADPYNESNNKICSSNDLYYSEEQKLLLIQLRAPVLKDYVASYTQNVLDYLKSVDIDELIVLAGLFGHQRDDNDILGGSFRYITSSQGNANHEKLFNSQNWLRMKGNEAKENFACPILEGGGITRTLFNSAVTMKLPCLGLLLFCSDGDNSEDSLQLLTKLNSLLSLMSEDLKDVVYPPSWKYLFGNSVPKDIY